MKNNLSRFIAVVLFLSACSVKAQKTFTDTLSTAEGDLVVHVLGHSSVLFEYNGLAVYVDPYSKVYDFTGMVKADLILITHSHDDHFDTLAIGKIKQPNTLVIYTQACADSQFYAGQDTIMANGDSIYALDMLIKAVPAYSIVKTKHPKGFGNGYVILFGEKHVYISGDTEKIPEMEDLKNIDMAFLPFVHMTAEIMAETAIMINPDILIPYHYDNADCTPLLELFKDIPGIEVWTGQPVTSVGVANPHLNSNILFSPNPVFDILKSEELKQYSTARIYDVAGHMVAAYFITDNGELNVDDLPEGQYILLIETNDQAITGRFTK